MLGMEALNLLNAGAGVLGQVKDVHLAVRENDAHAESRVAQAPEPPPPITSMSLSALFQSAGTFQIPDPVAVRKITVVANCLQKLPSPIRNPNLLCRARREGLVGCCGSATRGQVGFFRLLVPRVLRLAVVARIKQEVCALPSGLRCIDPGYPAAATISPPCLTHGHNLSIERCPDARHGRSLSSPRAG